ncbi:MAG: winged helix DNA-binding domain-containing protein [Acidimicrobiia bacterium]
MRTVTDPERRARLAVRHHLAGGSDSVEVISNDVVGFHSSDPATVFLSAWARIDGFEPRDLEEALYEKRVLVRMLGMRRTLFVIPVGLAPVVNAACTAAYRQSERQRLIGLLEDQGITEEGEEWLDKVENETMAALVERGEATAAELTDDVLELGLKISFGEGKRWAGTVGVSTRILFLLATQGMIVRGRPRGKWLSSQYRWAATVTWLGREIAPEDPVQAKAEVAQRWLRAFGPGTLTDLKWWTGWTVRDTRWALQEIGAVEVELTDGTGFVLADDVEAPQEEVEPWVALLPSLDPTVMGWKERDWYFGGHQAALFDRNGNAGPTVWADGKVVGGWGQRSDGEPVVNLLEDVGSESAARIQAEVGRLSEWLGELIITPRFRTSLEKEIRSS